MTHSAGGFRYSMGTVKSRRIVSRWYPKMAQSVQASTTAITFSRWFSFSQRTTGPVLVGGFRQA